jgi:hypothetical protein
MIICETVNKVRRSAIPPICLLLVYKSYRSTVYQLERRSIGSQAFTNDTCTALEEASLD